MDWFPYDRDLHHERVKTQASMNKEVFLQIKSTASLKLTCLKDCWKQPFFRIILFDIIIPEVTKTLQRK